ncbi:MAG: hypothetical protein ACOYLG_09955 [Chitinophagaceae bacterium]
MRRVEAEALRERKVYKRSILPMARFLIYLFMVLSFMGRLHAQSFTLVLQNKERDYNWGLSFYCNDSVYQLFVTNWVGFIVSKLLISDGVVIRSQSRIEFEDDKKTIIGAFVKKQERWYLDYIHFNCKGIILSKNERIFKDCTPDPQRAVVKASSLKSLYEDSKEDYYKRSKIRRFHKVDIFRNREELAIKLDHRKQIGTIYVKDRFLYQGHLQYIGDSLGRILNKENKEIAEFKMNEDYPKALYLKFLNRYYELLKLNKNETYEEAAEKSLRFFYPKIRDSI